MKLSRRTTRFTVGAASVSLAAVAAVYAVGNPFELETGVRGKALRPISCPNPNSIIGVGLMHGGMMGG